VLLERDQPPVPEPVDRGLQRLRGPGVVQPDVGRLAPGVVAGLGPDPPPGLVRVHPAPADQPFDPLRLRRVHDHDQVVRRPPAVLHQQGHVVDHHGVRRGLRDQRLGALPDPGVDDRVQAPAGRFVAEHDPAERGPVQRPVRAQHPGPELGHDRRQPRRPGLHHLPGQPVGVDDAGPAGRQPRRDRRLARPDPPGQPDPEHEDHLRTETPSAPGLTHPGRTAFVAQLHDVTGVTQ
jgi:hypothetical protein